LNADGPACERDGKTTIGDSEQSICKNLQTRMTKAHSPAWQAWALHEQSEEKSYVPLINVTGMPGTPRVLAHVVKMKVATHKSMLRPKVTSEASPLML
jgi:hypothetical protein